ncbi:MAG: hypothetical protein ACP5FL_08725, partial [Thermoplasmatota archaeon]
MPSKLVASLVCMSMMLSALPLIAAADPSDDPDPLASTLTVDEIAHFVDTWSDILLLPDGYNLSTLPPEDRYANYTEAERQILIDALIQQLENLSVEVWEDLHPVNATAIERQEAYDRMATFLTTFIFEREELLNQLENEDNEPAIMENYTGSDLPLQEDDTTIVWGESDTCQGNLGDIQQAGQINDIDTALPVNASYPSEIDSCLITTSTPPCRIEDTFTDISEISHDDIQQLQHPFSSAESQSLFTCGNVTFTSRLGDIVGKLASILDALTYTVYTESGNTTTYTKRLTFCRTHRLNVDDQLLTGPLGKDISIRAGLRVIPSLREKTVFIGVDLTVRRLCTLRNRTLPLELIAFFRIPDSTGGRNDHVVMLGYSSEKTAFNTVEQAPRRVSFSLLVNLRGELVVDVQTRGAPDGLKVIAGIGTRNVDPHGNVGIVNVTTLQHLFRPAPTHFSITLDTARFKLEPLTLTLDTCTPVSIAT